jgi:hypothetical protein
VPPLSDEAIWLEPLDGRFVPDFDQLADDPDIVRFTRVPSAPDAGFTAAWVSRYVSGWDDGSRAGFAILSLDGAFLGMVAIVELDLAGRQGEIGYYGLAGRPRARSRRARSFASSPRGRWGRSGWSGSSFESARTTSRRCESPSGSASYARASCARCT